MRPTFISALVLLLAATQANALLIESDFEKGVIGQKAQGPSGATFARSATLFSNEVVLSGTQSAKGTLTAGDNGSKTWGFDYIYPQVGQGEELWFRTWFYFENNWKFTTGPKQTRIHVSSGGGGNVGYFDFFIREQFIKMDSEISGGMPPPADCYSKDVPSLFLCNMGPERKHVINMDMEALRGTWMAVEMYVKFHSTPGQGKFRTWLNGKLVFEDLESPTLESSTDVSKLIFIHTQWNDPGSPQAQSNYYDDIVIVGGSEAPSNKDAAGNLYVGTGDVTFRARPNPPTVGP